MARILMARILTMCGIALSLAAGGACGDDAPPMGEMDAGGGFDTGTGTTDAAMDAAPPPDATVFDADPIGDGSVVDDAAADGGGDDAGPDTSVPCIDMDGDGYGDGCVAGADCDDDDPGFNPGAAEDCNGLDEDCSGTPDDNLTPPACTMTMGVCGGAVPVCGGATGWRDCDYGPDYQADETLCDTLDNDCDGDVDEFVGVWYVDCDGDGLAESTAGSMSACTEPPSSATGCDGSWTSVEPVDPATTDCADTSARAFPGQTLYATTPIPGEPPATDFDYDCNGTEEKLYPRRARTIGDVRCPGPVGGSCADVGYWNEPTIPECGMMGMIWLCNDPGTCGPVPSLARQACR